MPPPGRVLVLSGVMAAGKSTVAALVAQELPQCVHLRGDVFRRMVVGGRVEMTADPSEEALRQLRLRYDAAALVADRYAAAGFDVVLQDVVLGPDLPALVERLTTPRRYVVVLAPSAAEVARREASRAKTGYTDRLTVAELDRVLREHTPRIGLWLDTTGQTPARSAHDVLDRLEEAAV